MTGIQCPPVPTTAVPLITLSCRSVPTPAQDCLGLAHLLLVAENAGFPERFWGAERAECLEGATGQEGSFTHGPGCACWGLPSSWQRWVEKTTASSP